MIKILRSECPQVLKDGKKYNHKDVVYDLWCMQYKKCCYCEHYIPEEGHLKAVEHFKPKSIFKMNENDWNNLLLACSQCNGKKSNKFPVILTDKENEIKVVYLKEDVDVEPMIIDPASNDPEEHIDFILDDTLKEGEQIWGLIFGKDTLGELTIDVIGLDGLFYTKVNREHLNMLTCDYLQLLEAIDNENNEKTLRLKERFETNMSANHKHATLTRAFARSKNLQRIGIKILKEAEIA